MLAPVLALALAEGRPRGIATSAPRGALSALARACAADADADAGALAADATAVSVATVDADAEATAEGGAIIPTAVSIGLFRARSPSAPPTAATTRSAPAAAITTARGPPERATPGPVTPAPVALDAASPTLPLAPALAASAGAECCDDELAGMGPSCVAPPSARALLLMPPDDATDPPPPPGAGPVDTASCAKPAVGWAMKARSSLVSGVSIASVSTCQLGTIASIASRICLASSKRFVGSRRSARSTIAATSAGTHGAVCCTGFTSSVQMASSSSVSDSACACGACPVRSW